jgi:hypothetical protein
MMNGLTRSSVTVTVTVTVTVILLLLFFMVMIGGGSNRCSSRCSNRCSTRGTPTAVVYYCGTPTAVVYYCGTPTAVVYYCGSRWCGYDGRRWLLLLLEAEAEEGGCGLGDIMGRRRGCGRRGRGHIYIDMYIIYHHNHTGYILRLLCREKASYESRRSNQPLRAISCHIRRRICRKASYESRRSNQPDARVAVHLHGPEERAAPAKRVTESRKWNSRSGPRATRGHGSTRTRARHKSGPQAVECERFAGPETNGFFRSLRARTVHKNRTKLRKRVEKRPRRVESRTKPYLNLLVRDLFPPLRKVFGKVLITKVYQKKMMTMMIKTVNGRMSSKP